MPDYEIELTDGRKFRITADRPPSEAEVLAALGQQSAQPQQAQEPAAPPMKGMLPTVGGMVGSLVGAGAGSLLAPFTGGSSILAGKTLGAGLGGALGKGAELFLDEKDDSVGDTLSAMGRESVLQGAGDLAGGVAGKGLTLIGKGAYKAGAAMLPKSLKQEFPRMAKAGFDEGVSLTNRGMEKAKGLMKSSAQATRDKLSMMERAGSKPIDPQEIVGQLTRTEAKVAKQPMRAADLATVDAMRKGVLAENPNPIPLTAAHDMKQAAQRTAQEGYRILNRGTQQINRVPLDANMDIARGLRGAIEDRVPSIGPMNQRTEDLLGLMRGAEHAGSTAHVVPRGLGALGAGAIGSGGGAWPAAAAALAGGALTTPGGLTSIGLGLKGAGGLTEKYGVNAARAALLAALLSQEQ